MTLAICFGGLALCGLAMVLLYGHELRRMARFLRARDGRSNSRLTTEMPGPGFADLARAVNGTLDAADQRERERAAEQRQFQRDLASLSHDIRTPLMGAKGYVSLAAEEPDDARRAHYLQAAEARLTDMEACWTRCSPTPAPPMPPPSWICAPSPLCRARRSAHRSVSRFRRARLGASGGLSRRVPGGRG